MNYKEKLKHISTFIFDVDGVLTDGKIILMPDGEQLRNMNVKDGMAIRTAIEKGFIVSIISGGKGKGLEQRFKYLNITDVYLGSSDKVDSLSDLMHVHDLEFENILYVGDDINDWEVMKTVGLACCPQDAVPEIKNIADYISHKKGGNGCVREIIEQTLKAQNKW